MVYSEEILHNKYINTEDELNIVSYQRLVTVTFFTKESIVMFKILNKKSLIVLIVRHVSILCQWYYDGILICRKIDV